MNNMELSWLITRMIIKRRTSRRVNFFRFVLVCHHISVMTNQTRKIFLCTWWSLTAYSCLRCERSAFKLTLSHPTRDSWSVVKKTTKQNVTPTFLSDHICPKYCYNWSNLSYRFVRVKEQEKNWYEKIHKCSSFFHLLHSTKIRINLSIYEHIKYTRTKVSWFLHFRSFLSFPFSLSLYRTFFLGIADNVKGHRVLPFIVTTLDAGPRYKLQRPAYIVYNY